MAGNDIVTIAVSQLVAPTPNTLQKTGAVISQGGTTLADGANSLLTQASDLTPLLTGAIATTALAWSVSVVTVTLAGPHGVTTGDTVPGVIVGALPVGYNGTFQMTATGANTLTYPLVSNPGSATQQGTFTLEDVGELAAFVGSFFNQGSAAALYVLELGAGTAAEGVTALTTYIANPALQFYAYGVPSNWGAEATFATLCSNNTALTKKLYFLPILALSGANVYTPFKTLKSVLGTVQTVTPTIESDPAEVLYNILQTNPSNVNKLTPFAFRFLFGATPLNPTGPNGVILRTNFLNYVDTGAEGGISNTLLKFGTTMDGRDFAYWYAADWVQINMALALANAIINGNNDPTNPLYYNQQGINTLQAVAQGVMNRAVGFGIASGNPLVTAVSFADYTKANPSDYVNGIYNGLAVTFTPQTGFKSITFNLVISDLAAP